MVKMQQLDCFRLLKYSIYISYAQSHVYKATYLYTFQVKEVLLIKVTYCIKGEVEFYMCMRLVKIFRNHFLLVTLAKSLGIRLEISDQFICICLLCSQQDMFLCSDTLLQFFFSPDYGSFIHLLLF